jgi:hypothetical protein
MGHKKRKTKLTGIVFNGPVHIDTVNNNIFNNTDPTAKPTDQEALERAGDGFKPGPGAEFSDESDLGSIEDDEAEGNACKASCEVSAEWVHAPCVIFRANGAWFNNAAILAYGLRYGMQIIPTHPTDWRAVRFFLGAENFANHNARNKTGHYSMEVEHNDRPYLLEDQEGWKTHVDRTGLDGRPYANPSWKLGSIRASTRTGRFPLTHKRPDLIGKIGRLYVDRRYHNTLVLPGGRREKAYYVLYTRVAELKEIPRNVADKLGFPFKDYLIRKAREVARLPEDLLFEPSPN